MEMEGQVTPGWVGEQREQGQGPQNFKIWMKAKFMQHTFTCNLYSAHIIKIQQNVHTFNTLQLSVQTKWKNTQISC